MTGRIAFLLVVLVLTFMLLNSLWAGAAVARPVSGPTPGHMPAVTATVPAFPSAPVHRPSPGTPPHPAITVAASPRG